MYILTARCSDPYMENSKNHKKMILPVIIHRLSVNVLLNNITFLCMIFVVLDVWVCISPLRCAVHKLHCLHLYLLFYYRRSLQLMHCALWYWIFYLWKIIWKQHFHFQSQSCFHSNSHRLQFPIETTIRFVERSIMSNCCRFWNIKPQMRSDRDLDLSRSRDVIDHMIILSAVCGFI